MRDEVTNARFAVNPQVLHESIDGEVMIIDLTTGSYYSLRGSAAEIWELVARSPGATSDEVAEAVVARYDSNGSVAPAVTTFLDELADERLVDVLPATDERGEGFGTLAGRDGQAARAFEAPVLEKYTDMQDLVLLDPVHQVDESGWPRQAGTARGDVATS